MSTASSAYCPASMVPRARYHLLHIPPSRGSPTMLRLATRKAPMVSGIARPIPSSSLTSVRWWATSIAPAQKKRVILANACITMWSPAPTIPHALASRAPMTM